MSGNNRIWSPAVRTDPVGRVNSDYQAFSSSKETEPQGSVRATPLDRTADWPAGGAKMCWSSS